MWFLGFLIFSFVLVGIKTRGVPIANRIAKKIESIEGQSINTGEVDITLYRDDLKEVNADPVINGSNIKFDINDKVVYIFKFPEEYLNEYNCLLNSQYSKFGDDAKQLILRFWGEVYSGNSAGVNFLLKVKQILYKEEKLKERLQIQKQK